MSKKHQKKQPELDRRTVDPETIAVCSGTYLAGKAIENAEHLASAAVILSNAFEQDDLNGVTFDADGS